MRYLKFIPALFLLASCIAEPDFPDAPSIGFVSVENRAFQGLDSVYITISFEDGDGDLGLSSNDNEGQFAPSVIENGVQVPNRFFNNFFIQILRRNGENLVPVAFPDGATFDGRFPRLNEAESTNAIEGELTYAFELFVDALGSPISRGDVIAFEVQIADRSLNESNTVTTGTITAGISSQ